MTRPLIQIGDEVREMNDAEYSQYQQDMAAAETERLEMEAAHAARVSALAKLAALGLTEPEIAALLA